MSLGLAVAMAVFGVAILGFGAYVARYAEKTTRDARATLQAMFGQTMPQLFEAETSPTGARITGIVAIVAGVLLLAAAVVLLLVG